MHVVSPVLVGRDRARELERAASLLGAAAGGAGTVASILSKLGLTSRDELPAALAKE